MHIHLNPVGGIAGDMFISAIVDAWPELCSELKAAVRCAHLDDRVQMRIEPHCDQVLTGTRFEAAYERDERAEIRFRDIRDQLLSSSLSDAVKRHAIGIFTLLAKAEGEVHGVEAEDVSFHEIGATDSITDIIGAATVIDALRDVSWSCDPLPMGSGRTESTHGELPLPAPAVAVLLKGFPLFHDGRQGERVTPTGAAILRHLDPSFAPVRAPMALVRTGTGFGTFKFEGISNVLRALVFEAPSEPVIHEFVGVIAFEVDDQSPEDLSMGLERLRDRSHVLDVSQIPIIGKKGRMGAQIQVFTRPEAIDEVASACLSETSTLGVRCQVIERVVLARESAEYVGANERVRVKYVKRPDGTRTAKAEADDLADVQGGFAQRGDLRRQAEEAIIRGDLDEP